MFGDGVLAGFNGGSGVDGGLSDVDITFQVNIMIINGKSYKLSDNDIKYIKKGFLHSLKWFYNFINIFYKNNKAFLLVLFILNSFGEGIAFTSLKNIINNYFSNIYVCDVTRGIALSCHKLEASFSWPFKDENDISSVFLLYR